MANNKQRPTVQYDAQDLAELRVSQSLDELNKAWVQKLYRAVCAERDAEREACAKIAMEGARNGACGESIAGLIRGR